MPGDAWRALKNVVHDLRNWQDLVTTGVNSKVDWSRPAFCATKSAAATQANIGAGAWVTVTWDAELFDVGANFAANQFTVPVAGQYLFGCGVNLEQIDTAATLYQMQIWDGTTTNFVANLDPRQFVGDVAGPYTLSATGFLDLAAAVTVLVRIYQTGGANQTDIVGNSYFWGLRCL